MRCPTRLDAPSNICWMPAMLTASVHDIHVDQVSRIPRGVPGYGSTTRSLHQPWRSTSSLATSFAPWWLATSRTICQSSLASATMVAATITSERISAARMDKAFWIDRHRRNWLRLGAVFYLMRHADTDWTLVNERHLVGAANDLAPLTD